MTHMRVALSVLVAFVLGAAPAAAQPRVTPLGTAVVEQLGSIGTGLTWLERTPRQPQVVRQLPWGGKLIEMARLPAAGTAVLASRDDAWVVGYREESCFGDSSCEKYSGQRPVRNEVLGAATGAPATWLAGCGLTRGCPTGMTDERRDPDCGRWPLVVRGTRAVLTDFCSRQLILADASGSAPAVPIAGVLGVHQVRLGTRFFTTSGNEGPVTVHRDDGTVAATIEPRPSSYDLSARDVLWTIEGDALRRREPADAPPETIVTDLPADTTVEALGDGTIAVRSAGLIVIRSPRGGEDSRWTVPRHVVPVAHGSGIAYLDQACVAASLVELARLDAAPALGTRCGAVVPLRFDRRRHAVRVSCPKAARAGCGGLIAVRDRTGYESSGTVRLLGGQTSWIAVGLRPRGRRLSARALVPNGEGTLSEHGPRRTIPVT